MAASELAIYQPDAQVGDLKLWRVPEQVLAEAQQAATALQKRIAGKLNPVKFNGEQYVENDDWQMVANFFNYAPKVISCDYVEFGTTVGFKAVAELVIERGPDRGTVIGRGEAFCLNEEDNWGERTKYQWQNGKRVAVGQVSTPLFQLASMAQTRACNKAMSNKLKWVVSLAGYATTPAEDMHAATVEEKPQPQPVDDLPTEIRRKPVTAAPVKPIDPPRQSGPTPAQMGYATQQRPTPTAPPSRGQTISEAQGRRFYALWKSSGKDKQQVEEYLHNVLGIQSDRDMPVARYAEACAWAEKSDGGKW
jgi:hypothetical protein